MTIWPVQANHATKACADLTIVASKCKSMLCVYLIYTPCQYVSNAGKMNLHKATFIGKL
jgi:hypothetical protein